jgi:hypothetical protein
MMIPIYFQGQRSRSPDVNLAIPCVQDIEITICHRVMKLDVLIPYVERMIPFNFQSLSFADP